MLTSDPELPAAALIGRGQELELLGSFVDRAAVDGETLVLSGEPGVGKSALLDVAAERASSAGVKVLRAAGVQFEADLSFSGLHQLLFAEGDEISHLGAPHRAALRVALGLGGGPPPERLVISNSVLLLLQRMALARPVLMIVDDLPWVDRASAELLGFVARRVAGSRVGFLGAARSGSDGFFEGAGFAHHHLDALDPDAASQLLADRFPALAPNVRHRLLAEAQGNPLALLELPSALSGQQRAASQSLPAVLPLGGRLHALFERRITQLPRPTRHLLLLSVLDGSGDLRVLKTCADHDQWLEDLAHAEAQRLIDVDDRKARVVFRHPLIRSAIVELSTSLERRDAHERLAQHFADEPERRAWHLAEASTEPDEEVAALLEAAAHLILRRGDPSGAISAMSRAAELSPSPSDRGRRLLDAAYLGAHLTGDLRAVSENLGQARQADPQLGASLSASATAAYLLISGDGDIDGAHRLLIAAIPTNPPSDHSNDPELGHALHLLFTAAFFSGQRELWEPYLAALARLESHVPATLYLLTQLHADPIRTAPAHLDALASAIAGLTNEVDPYVILGVSAASSFVDRLGACREGLWRVARGARESGADTVLAYALGHLCLDDFMAGQWAEAQHHADEGVALCQTNGDRLLGWPFTYYQALLGAVRGDADIAHAKTQEITQWAAPRRALTPLRAAHHASALAAIGSGDYEDAYQHATAVSPPGTFAPYACYAPWVMLDLVEAAVRTNRATEASAHVAAMCAEHIAELSPHLALLVGGSAAIAATDSAAPDLFDETLAIAGIDRWPFDVARVQLAHGERLRRARSTLAARKHLTAALDAFQRIGARPWAARAGTELRATGGESRATRDAAGQTALTPQEHEIAGLAAAGLTNKQIAERLFLSHRTVGAHLYRIFPKLGVTSRAALRDALADTQRLAPGHHFE